MAERPIFIPLGKTDHLVKEVVVKFKWNPGFAPVQKKKNIAAMHESARTMKNMDGEILNPLLEISTKSEVKLGIRLSAFNLRIDTESEIGEISMEAAFQGSKVFKNGGPYRNISGMDSRKAKKDPRLRESQLIGFDYFGQEWPLVPKTAFYDWLYLSALSQHREFLMEELYKYKGFTDIEFNPKKSINCQARTCAMLVSLLKLDALSGALKTQDSFIDIVSSDSLKKNHSIDLRQGKLDFSSQ